MLYLDINNDQDLQQCGKSFEWIVFSSVQAFWDCREYIKKIPQPFVNDTNATIIQTSVQFLKVDKKKPIDKKGDVFFIHEA